MDWVDRDGTAVSLRIEDGSLNLYGDGSLAMPGVKYFQVLGMDMSFSTREDFQNSAQSTAPNFAVKLGVQRLIGTLGHMANQVPSLGDGPGWSLPSVEWRDAEGDVISLHGTGASVALYSNAEEVMDPIQDVHVHRDNDGLTLTFVSGDLTASTVVRGASDARTVQDFLKEHVPGALPDGARTPQHAQQQADALRLFTELVQREKERSRQRPEVAGIFVEDQKDFAEPKAVVTQYHVLHLGRRTFEQTVLPTTGYPVENWIVMFRNSQLEEPYNKISDLFSARSREWEAKLNQDLFTTHVRFATVDCATDKELCNAQEVDVYPHVKHYSEGVAVGKWTGSREKDETRLAKWLTRRLGASKKKPEGGEQPEAAQPDLSVVAREQGVNALLVLGVSALVFHASCLDAELWKGLARSPPAAAWGGPWGPPAKLHGLPAEWARRGSVEL